ncbi:unnamed protein product, partial [Prorocentrum cordatum]
VCADIFSSFTCARYQKYGWCQREDMKDAVQRQCPLTCGQCTNKPSASQSDGAGDDDDDDGDGKSDDSGGSSDAANDTDDKDSSDDDDDSDESKGTDSKDGPACRCMRSWTSPGDEGCEKEQRYCPEKPCDGDAKHWCLVETPGCATEAREDGEGQGWAYCSPE